MATSERSLILVVDDDPSLRLLARAALEGNGFSVQEAADGVAALEMVRHCKPDLILLDVVMPGLDGFAFCRRLRSQPGFDYLPICMMTGLEDTDSINAAYEAGATDFITKPVNWTILGHRLRYLLRASRALAEVIGAQARTRAILEAIPDAMMRISKEGFIRESRDPWGLGLPSITEGAEVSVYEALPARRARELMLFVQEVVDTGEPRVFEGGMRREGVRVEWEVRVVRSGAGEALCLIRDITERKRTEQALRESEERYALASQAANDGLWDWDIRAQEFHFSLRWKRLLGYEESEIGSDVQEWFGRIHPQDIERVKVELNSHLEGLSSHFESEHRLLHKDGSYRWMLCRGIAQRDESGKAYRMVGSQTDITRRKEVEEQLLRDAMYDALTGLPNRALFLDRLDRTLKRKKRGSLSSFAVFFLDLDRFKVINDSFGHVTGDAVLVEAARRVERCLRANDTVARLGGDEFVILCEEIGEGQSARIIAERIRASFAEPFHHGGHEIFSSVSLGAAMGSAEYDTAEDLIRDADIAMYRAKALGRGRIVFFDPSQRQQAVAMLHLENDLRAALERREFRLHYQPIFTLKEGRITAVEALLRWQHPHRGLLSPLEFIPLAEETGLIVPIGEWVLREACGRLKKWLDEGMQPLRMAVNVSAVQLGEGGFASLVQEVLEKEGLAAEYLALEITETVLMDESREMEEELLRLRCLGVHLSIDDFGTGYSSLNYLQKLPIDTLKIDRSFIDRLAFSGEQGKIVETILFLGGNLGLEVVAEGIETKEQLERLRAINCRSGQGYVFAKPLEEEELRPLLLSLANVEGMVREDQK